MKLQITIDTGPSDDPVAPRINHALAGLLYHALEKDLGGIYRFEFPQYLNDFPLHSSTSRPPLVAIVTVGRTD